MKVFLSWSGPRSKAVADAFFSWLPLVLHSVDPWMSSEIGKGQRWGAEISNQLEETLFGIICLTSDNLSKPWINFEAGALSKTTSALVWTFLFDVSPADVEQPLGQFQHTINNKEDIRKLISTINEAIRQSGERSPTSIVLQKSFESFWPDLQAAFEAVPPIEHHNNVEAQPSDRTILEELLELARRQETRQNRGEHADSTRVRLLVVPADALVQPLDLERELTGIEAGIRLGTMRDRFSIAQVWAASTDRLLQAMLDEVPSIVHFSGVGSKGGIVLRSELGEVLPVEVGALGELFSLFGDTVTCVVLSRCWSEMQARAIRRYVNTVVGSIPSVPSRTDGVFWTAFYNAIASGKDIPFAFQLGKARVSIDDKDSDDGFLLL